MKTFFFTVLCGMLLAGQAMAQAVNTLPRVLDSKVKSVQIAPSSNPYLPPIYVMGSDDVLNITFDYLDYDVHYLRYSVRHCNANWQPSVLVPSEYVSGFNEADITDYAQSNSTFVHYYNYNFTLPNADMQFYKSGNYLLTVYEQDTPEKVLFQARLAVCENTVAVHVDATSRTDVDYNDRHQQVSFTVDYKQGLIADPYNELTAVVSQNSRLDNEVYLTRPFMVSPGQVTTTTSARSFSLPAMSTGASRRSTSTRSIWGWNVCSTSSPITMPRSGSTRRGPPAPICTTKRNTGISRYAMPRATTVPPRATISSPTSASTATA